MIEIGIKVSYCANLYHETAKFDFINRKFYLKQATNNLALCRSKIRSSNRQWAVD